MSHPHLLDGFQISLLRQYCFCAHRLADFRRTKPAARRCSSCLLSWIASRRSTFASVCLRFRWSRRCMSPPVCGSLCGTAYIQLCSCSVRTRHDYDYDQETAKDAADPKPAGSPSGATPANTSDANTTKPRLGNHHANSAEAPD